MATNSRKLLTTRMGATIVVNNGGREEAVEKEKEERMIGLEI